MRDRYLLNTSRSLLNEKPITIDFSDWKIADNVLSSD